VFSSQRGRTAAFVAVAALALVTVGTGLLLQRSLPALSDPVALRAWIAGYGPAAPIVFAGLQALQVLVAPIPGHLLGLASGYLFGAVPGTLYSLAGATVGSALAFSLSRRFGRPFAESVIAGETLATFDEAIERRGLVALFVVFLVPGLPDDVICLIAGLTRLSIPRMVAVSAVGRLPGYFLVNLAGAGVASGDTATAAAVLAVVAAASVLALWRRDAVLGWLRG
jgi:uncharacterized membrane protein YdjX (TVP38/TMEM64 family)